MPWSSSTGVPAPCCVYATRCPRQSMSRLSPPSRLSSAAMRCDAVTLYSAAAPRAAPPCAVRQDRRTQREVGAGRCSVGGVHEQVDEHLRQLTGVDRTVRRWLRASAMKQERAALEASALTLEDLVPHGVGIARGAV